MLHTIVTGLRAKRNQIRNTIHTF